MRHALLPAAKPATALGAHQGEARKLDRYRAAVTAVKGQKLVC